MSELILVKQPSYCFVESFDSVRYAKSENIIDRNMQAELELIYSLLLGQRIVVPEFHSFDSIGFLDIVTEALESPTRKSNLNKAWISSPFLLRLRPGNTSYTNMVAASIRNKNFILSSMPEINDDLDFRSEMAKLIEERNFDQIERRLDQSGNSNCKIIIDKIIKTLSQYFEQQNYKPAKTFPGLLKTYVLKLIDRDDFPPELMKNEGFQVLRKGLQTLVDTEEVNFANRGDVRRKGRQYLDPDVYDGVLEYVDSCYNAVIYKAIGAKTGILSTVENTMGRYVILAQQLSEASVGFTEEEFKKKDIIKLWINNSKSAEIQERVKSYWIETQSDSNSSPAEKQERKGNSWIEARPDRWGQIWEIMLNDRWIESANRFIGASDETKTDAYKCHIEVLQLLTEDLPTISLDKSEKNSQFISATYGNETVAEVEHDRQESEQAHQPNESDSSTALHGYGSTPGCDL